MHRYRKSLIVLGVLNSILLIVVLTGFGMGYQATQRAKRMKSYPYINNDRCMEKVKALSQSEGDVIFAVVGDIQREVKKLPLLMSSIKQTPDVAFIIQTGDAVAHANSGHYRLFLDELAQCGLEAPLFVVPGNHDVKYDRENLFRSYFGSRRFWFEYGNALFIVADTASGGWNEEKSDWLRQVLESHRAANRHVFLFMHQLPLDNRGVQENPIQDTDERLHKLIEDYNVDYVFSGHRHEYRREEWRGTTFIINGEDDDFDTHKEGSPFCYSLVRVSNDSIEDAHEVLKPNYDIFIMSNIKDMWIAHLGDYLMRRHQTCVGTMLLLAMGVIVPLVLWYKSSYTAGLKKKHTMHGMYHWLRYNLLKLSG